MQLVAPTHLYFERVTETMLKLGWRSDQGGQTSFTVFKDGEILGETGPDQREYLITSGLETGTIYNIGVRAEGDGEKYLSSEVAVAQYNMIPKSQLPSVSVEAVVGTPSCIAVTARLRDTGNFGDQISCGLCWSEENQIPTIEDGWLSGPEIPEIGTTMQVIPNLYLEYGKTYAVRNYIKSEKGIHYGPIIKASLGEEPQAVNFNWTRVENSELPSEIELFTTTDKLSGRNFRAWYAKADLRGTGIEFRTNVPAELQTIDTQAASFWGDCYLMVNGGYFASGQHTGIAINDYVVNGRINNARGSLRQSDKENNEIYLTARGIFGVDDNGEASVYWATGSKPDYFDRPIPSIKGEQKFRLSLNEYESASYVEWMPRAAISAGPVLLKDGKRPFDFTNTPNGDEYYYSNYEFIAYDIFDPESICDRTAIGCTQDGEVIIFICDGRIASSEGADMEELAMIMKGLGCVQALNLDGGGSTGMMAGSVHLGDLTPENRKVSSTVGFFRRK